MTSGHRQRLGACLLGATSAFILLGGGCKSRSNGAAGSTTDGGPPFDCVDVLRTVVTRGYGFANVHRLGRDNPPFRLTLRVGDLSPADVAALCDWEACVLTNGYAHMCFINDAGIERCRVCDGGADCANHLSSRDECVASAQLPERRDCHVGLMQECLIQRGLRGYPDARKTATCYWADQSCAGQLPGDLTPQALWAQHETDQVTVQVFKESSFSLPDGGESDFQKKLDQWEGGLPSEVSAGGAADAGDAGK